MPPCPLGTSVVVVPGQSAMIAVRTAWDVIKWLVTGKNGVNMSGKSGERYNSSVEGKSQLRAKKMFRGFPRKMTFEKEREGSFVSTKGPCSLLLLPGIVCANGHFLVWLHLCESTALTSWVSTRCDSLTDECQELRDWLPFHRKGSAGLHSYTQRQGYLVGVAATTGTGSFSDHTALRPWHPFFSVVRQQPSLSCQLYA